MLKWNLVRLVIAASLVLTLAGSRSMLAGPPVVLTDPLTPEEQLKKFKLPAGFEIQLVAAEPDIQKPMNLAFDSQGRLWVTHSIEYPFAATDPTMSRDGLTILDGIGPDGKATKVTKFAEKLNIPIGILPLPNGREVIVWSIPNIWKLTDTDGDGVADEREVLYGPFDFADTHGNQNSFRLGLDGWVYACHGFRNASKIQRRGEGPVVLEMQSGNTYRFRPDGSAIEQISWGQVNPFGMCMDWRGDFFNADCHSKPITLLLRGAITTVLASPTTASVLPPSPPRTTTDRQELPGLFRMGPTNFPPSTRVRCLWGTWSRIRSIVIDSSGAAHPPGSSNPRIFSPVTTGGSIRSICNSVPMGHCTFVIFITRSLVITKSTCCTRCGIAIVVAFGESFIRVINRLDHPHHQTCQNWARENCSNTLLIPT